MEIVSDRLRADTFAKYYEEVHWAPDIHKMTQISKLNKHTYTQRAMLSINTYEITIEELDMAIKQLRRNKAPGPDGTTAELYKWLDPDNRAILLDTIT